MEPTLFFSLNLQRTISSILLEAIRYVKSTGVILEIIINKPFKQLLGLNIWSNLILRIRE
jgi:hypothetical protein